MTKKESIFILFSITLCWSSTYIFIKDIPQEFSVYAYLALTSGVAGILLTLVMRKKFALLNRVSLRQGLILGAQKRIDPQKAQRMPLLPCPGCLRRSASLPLSR